MHQEPDPAELESDSQALPAVQLVRFRARTTPIRFMRLWPTGYRGRYRELAAFFGVARPQITMWDTGARKMPDWARGLLINELEKQIAERQHVLDLLKRR